MSGLIAVVGCGIAGHEAAFAARSTDPESKIVIITQDAQPLYSPCVLTDYVAGEIPKSQVLLNSPTDYEKLSIELRLETKVVECSPSQRVLLLEDGELSYDKLVLATGSQPFIPSLPGVDKKGVFTFKSLADGELLRKTAGNAAVVVGSGPVGIEAAVGLRKRGLSVVLIEILDTVLPRIFDHPVAQSLQVLLEREGVEVLTRESVLEIMGDGTAAAVRTERRTIPCDLAVLVMGMKPNPR
jgi:NADPH-dependent 2,4-dienoyl-CoA reductase/sulfur reductase-like enzyme